MPPRGWRPTRAVRGAVGATASLRPSARRGHVAGSVGTAIEIDNVRIGAVAGQHDDEWLGRRRVGLDVYLAGGDVDEVARRRRHRVLDAGRAPGVVGGPGQ